MDEKLFDAMRNNGIPNQAIDQEAINRLDPRMQSALLALLPEIIYYALLDTTHDDETPFETACTDAIAGFTHGILNLCTPDKFPELIPVA